MFVLVGCEFRSFSKSLQRLQISYQQSTFSPSTCTGLKSVRGIPFDKGDGGLGILARWHFYHMDICFSFSFPSPASQANATQVIFNAPQG